MNSESTDWTLLATYLAGEATPAQVAELEQWLNLHPGRRVAVAELERRWKTFQSAGIADDPGVEWATVRASIHDAIHDAEYDAEVRERARAARPAVSGSGTRWSRTAALTVAVIAVAGLAGIASWLGRTPRRLAPTIFATTVSEWATVRLPNGSSATLAPATTVRVTGDVAVVNGQAYFQLQPRSDRPFTVRTVNAEIDVLGTKFSVRHYATDRSSRVIVVDGKIALRALRSSSPMMLPATPTILTAAMGAQVGDSGIAIQRGVPLRDDMAWLQGRLVFKAVPLREVVQELARAYGQDIRLADSALAARPMTFAASAQEDPLNKVLDMLALTVDAHVLRQGAAFVIASGRSSTSVPHIERFPQPEIQYGR